MLFNDHTGQCYVGQSSDPLRRYQQHSRKPPSKVAKYLSDFAVTFVTTFRLVILNKTSDKDTANDMERQYIECLSSTYNVLKGAPKRCQQYHQLKRMQHI